MSNPSSSSAQVIFIDNEIRPESEWDIDSEACGLCEKQFSMIGRRHHCRSCGLCACDTCAPYTIALTKNKIETCRIRICTVCSLSSLAVSPLSRISNPATPLVKGSAGPRLQEPTELNINENNNNLKSSPGPSSSSTSDPSGESPVLRPVPVVILRSTSNDTTQVLKTPPRATTTAGTASAAVPADPPSGKRGSIASNATVFEGSEDGRVGYKNIDADRGNVPLAVSPAGVRSPSSLLNFRLPTWVSSASSTASSKRSESPSKRSLGWRARTAHADIVNMSTHSSSGLHHHNHQYHDRLSSTGSSFSDDDSSIASGYTAPDIDDQGLPQQHRSTNDPTGRFSFSSLQGALYDYPVDMDDQPSPGYKKSNNLTTHDLIGTGGSSQNLLPRQHQQQTTGHISSSSPQTTQSSTIGVAAPRQPTPLHHLRVSSSSRASVGGASRVSNSSSSSIVVVKCSNCKKNLRTNTGIISVAGKTFCSKNCAFTSDYLDKASSSSSTGAAAAVDLLAPNPLMNGDNPPRGGGGGGGMLVRSERERQQEEREIAHALTQKMKGRENK